MSKHPTDPFLLALRTNEAVEELTPRVEALIAERDRLLEQIDVLTGERDQARHDHMHIGCVHRWEKAEKERDEAVELLRERISIYTVPDHLATPGIVAARSFLARFPRTTEEAESNG